MPRPSGSFLTSAVTPSQYPPPDLPEILLAGRSNSGKSTLINCFLGQALARVSQRPGKTRLLNFFSVGERYRIVDAPGYGFSKASGDEQAGWQKLVESYLYARKNLVGVLITVDCRRDWGETEELLRVFLNSRGIPLQIVVTKIDKYNASELVKCKSSFMERLRSEKVHFMSAKNAKSVQELEEHIFRSWIQKGKEKGKK